jgi:polysaccharide deacetylase family sporulation protein PdaB
MKIYIFNSKRLKVYSLILACLVLIVSSMSTGSSGGIGAFSAQRKVPVYSVETDEKLAAITFDCAWGADDIPQILATLKETDVKASFFMVGQWAEKNSQMVKQMSQEGHDVANHSYSHFRMGGLEREKISAEIKKCGDVIERQTGAKCDLFRAPYGDYSNSLLEEASQLSYFTIQWNVDSLDWRPGISEAEILQRIRNKITPGSIILFHNDTPHTAKLLPKIIAELKAEGYKLVPVSELILKEDFYIDHEGRQKKTHKNNNKVNHRI